MPKININSAFNQTSMADDNRKKAANNATSFLTSGVFENDKSKLDVKSVPIEKLRPRETNEFEQTGIDKLAQSIRLYGLINPLSVVYHEEEDVYIISSGHRRYLALKQLHEEYPNDDTYKHIDCAVYEVTTDRFKLAQGLPYITPEQEEGIYRDSNLENRQLTYSEVARQIRYLVKKFDDEDYVDRLRARAKEQGVITRLADYNKTKLILSVLSESHYDGWKTETIRQYLKIVESGQEELLDAIENNEMTVYAAYKKVVLDANQTRKRKTNRLPGLKKKVTEFAREAETRKYTDQELNQIQELISTLQVILDANKKS